MRRRPSYAIGTGLCLLLAACATVSVPPSASSIVLEKRVHFSAPDGADVVVAPGTYQVEQAEETQLRLVPATEGEQKPSLLIVAMATQHDEPLGGSLALSVPYKEDEHHVMLLLPEGKALDAVGSYSGVRTRTTAVPVLAAPTIKQYAIGQPLYRTLIPQGPDLKIISVAGIPSEAKVFSLSYGDIPKLTVTVRNVGTADVYLAQQQVLILGGGSPAQWYSGFIKPGESKTFEFFQHWSCPYEDEANVHIELKVDPYNLIAESNETNNTWMVTRPNPAYQTSDKLSVRFNSMLKPDLQVETMHYTPPNPTHYDRTEVHAAIKNSGNAPIVVCGRSGANRRTNDSIVGKIGLDDPASGYSTISPQFHTYMAPGMTIAGSAFIPAGPGGARCIRFRATADPYSVFSESNETNNDRLLGIPIDGASCQ